MNRFLINEKDLFLKEQMTVFKIEGKLFHHMFHVLRHKKGDLIEGISEQSNHYKLKIIEKSKREALAKVMDQKVVYSSASDFFLETPFLKLCLGLSRLSTMEKVIEKSVELGVHSFQPFISDLSFFKKKSKITESRKKRWDQIVFSACQQSNRGTPMQIEPTLFIEELWFEWEKEDFSQSSGLFAYEGSSEKNLQSIFSLPSFLFKKVPSNSSSLKNIWLFIGSEGGFSKREVKEFSRRNLFPMNLGKRILKVETACLTLVSIIKYELGREK